MGIKNAIDNNQQVNLNDAKGYKDFLLYLKESMGSDSIEATVLAANDMVYKKTNERKAA